jgi:hypothetical protein
MYSVYSSIHAQKSVMRDIVVVAVHSTYNIAGVWIQGGAPGRVTRTAYTVVYTTACGQASGSANFCV